MTGAAPALDALLNTLREHSMRTFDGITETLGTAELDGLRLHYLKTVSERPTRRTGLVVCHSFLEFATLQPAEVALVRRAAMDGFGSIYLLAPGAGESEGSPESCTVEARVKAVLGAASHLLGTEVGIETPCFFGARLGGAVAALAGTRFGQGAATVMWDPTFDADRYLTQARRVARISAIAGRQRDFEDVERQLEGREWASLLGNPVNRALLEDLGSIGNLDAVKLPGPALVVGTSERSLSAALSALRPRCVRIDSLSLKRRDLGSLGLSVKDAFAAIGPTLSWMTKELT